MMLLRGGAIARQQSASDATAAYHAAVTQYLSEQLARASSVQATLQQRRVEAEQQRHQKLADGAQKVLRSGPTGDVSATNLRGSAGALSQSASDDLAQELTKEQVQLFEEEASALIQSLQSELQAVQHAEQQLHDISELQTRIMQHLQEQNEQTSQLQTEAAGHGEQVTSGNVQLRKAKERNRAANRFLSMFFVISGLLLLIMHCMLRTNTRDWIAYGERLGLLVQFWVSRGTYLSMCQIWAGADTCPYRSWGKSMDTYPSSVRKSRPPPNRSAYNLTLVLVGQRT